MKKRNGFECSTKGMVAQMGSSRRGDPSLMVRLCNKKRTYLFDCGENNFTNSQLKQVDCIFISHAHIDHFIGFDRIVRVNLTDDKELLVLGPEGIVENVEGKLRGYTWNITEKLFLKIKVAALYGADDRVYEFFSNDGFKRRVTDQRINAGKPLDDDEITLTTARLDHKIASIGYSLHEKIFFNVRKDRLIALSLRPGPWLGELKRRLGNAEDLSGELLVEGKRFTLEQLKEELLIPKHQLRITYVTDVIYNDDNHRRILDLARGSTYFFCESYFMAEDDARAKDAFHLTTVEAASLAREAEVHRMVPFHISRRYPDAAALLKEVESVFPHLR